LDVEADVVCGQQTAETLSTTDAAGTTLLFEVTLLSGVCKAVGSGLVIAVRFYGLGTRMSLCTARDPHRAPGLLSVALTWCICRPRR